MSGNMNPAVGTAGVAQLVEQLICNQQVGGSNPSTSSKFHMGEFQSGQMGQTVNLLLRLRWFESTFPHQKVPAIAGAFLCSDLQEKWNL